MIQRDSIKYLVVFGALLITLAAPWLLRPAKPFTTDVAADRLVIISPHVESIQHEMTVGFRQHMMEKFGRDVEVLWMTPGGTTEIVMYLDTAYRAAFEHYWKGSQSDPWLDRYGSAMSDTKLKDNKPRELFLQSSVGVQVDLFFGGGVFDFERLKRKGYLVATDPTGTYGIPTVKKEHPDWFTDQVIPASFCGETFYDPELCWVGTCLSSFGICYNKDVLNNLGMREYPKKWADLTNPAFMGQLAAADPGKSGSAGKVFEMILQQEIQLAVARAKQAAGMPVADPKIEVKVPTEEEAIREGWARGLQIIQRLGANARYFTDSSTKPPLDVAKGEAAVGMCIDFYGRTFVERHKDPGGESRVAYFTPEGGSMQSVDPIAMLRGAPNPELATRFIEFVLSKPGQRLWNYRPGTPGGPEKVCLRRLPIRKDLYTPEERKHFGDPLDLPYEKTTFIYEKKYTEEFFRAIGVIVRVMCIDTHDELKEAWKALAENDFPPKATANFQDMRLVSYEKVREMSKTFTGSDKINSARLTQQLTAFFRHQYRKVAELARRKM